MVARLQVGDQQQIIEELEHKCGIRGASMDLAIWVQQNQKTTIIPEEY